MMTNEPLVTVLHSHGLGHGIAGQIAPSWGV